MSGVVGLRYPIWWRVQLPMSCGRLRDGGILRDAWRLWSRVSCALQHAAPVGGTEGQGLGLVRWFGETDSERGSGTKARLRQR